MPTFDPAGDWRLIRYTDQQGVHVLLAVPWPDGSGNIPPPTIRFMYRRFVDQYERVFVYDDVAQGGE